MTSDRDDMVLSALLAAASEVAPELPEEIVRTAYAIQRRHQFDRADMRESSMQDMQRLLEAAVASSIRDAA